MGSITVLVEGARLGVDEASIPMIKKKVRVLEALSMAWRKQRANTSLILQERRAHS
jgi:hypothetical protein